MLTQRRHPVTLSLVSYNLPIWSIIETEATLYQKDDERFHLLLTEPLIQDREAQSRNRADRGIESADDPFSIDNPFSIAAPPTPRLLWLEISPYRAIMTMQGNGQFSYRHFWEQGVYGVSRYWLQTDTLTNSYQVRLRNFTRSFSLHGRRLPHALRIEYELWAGQVELGHYVMNLEILHS